MIKLIKRSHTDKENEITNVQKFLTFTLGEDLFAIDLLKIQEIKNMEMNITKILDAPSHVMGMINFHEVIIPIVDLRIFFHLKASGPRDLNAMIITSVNDKYLGIVVDSVSDIIELASDTIKPAPDFFSVINHHYVEGIGETNAQLITIINVNNLISSEDLQITKLT